LRRTFILSGVVVAGLAAAWFGFRADEPAPEGAAFRVAPLPDSTAIIAGPGGHAYQYVAAPRISWAAAKAAARKRAWHGSKGYLATIDSEAEYRFIIDHVFAHGYSDVTYLGGRQTAPGQWRWVTGPDAKADGGKGKLFWLGDDQGAAVNGQYANWMASAFQHGGTWDIAKVCCVTLFSYGMPQYSTSLGSGGDNQEGVAGYLVEFGD
jgi:hypothetical protein